MSAILLKEWGTLWTQEVRSKQASNLWSRIELLIKEKRGKHSLDAITVEDVERGIKLMNSGTAVGTDKWSPYHWKQLSLEAKEAIAHLLNHVEKHWVWPGYIYIYILQYNCADGQASRGL